jgi:hypothetical protein
MTQLPRLSLMTMALLAVTGCATYSASTSSRVNSRCTRLARPGDTEIQMYCRSPDGDVVVRSGWHSKSCRRVVKPGDSTQVLNFCGRSEEWDVFDSWAVSADMTCRWAGTRQELCMDVAKWNGMDAAKWSDLNRKIPLAVVDWSEMGSNWPVSER